MSIPWRLNDYWISVGKCRKEKIMKLLCLSHIDEQKFDVMSDSERETFIKECFAYDNVLIKEWSFRSPGGAAKCAKRENFALPEWQGIHHRRPIR